MSQSVFGESPVVGGITDTDSAKITLGLTLRCHVFILNPCLQSQIVYGVKAKLFSLQLNNQSKILFRRFLPFTLSFSFVLALGEFIGTYSYQYDPEFTSLRVNAKGSASEIVSKLLFTHKSFVSSKLDIYIP